MADDPTGPPRFDAVALLQELRNGDEASIGRAYRAVFGTALGRFVLTHILAEAGVGRKFGSANLSGEELGYHQGGHDVALDIMDRAGFDSFAAALTVFTGQLEGQDHELSEPAAYAEPDLDA